MAEEPVAESVEEQEQEEGGPIKSFLEHLEDLRWVLIKSVVALGLAMLLCLIAGNYVVQILKNPLEKSRTSYPGTNQIVTVLFGTNQLGVFPVQPEQQAALDLGSNRFVAVRIEAAVVGTNRVLSWVVDNDPALAQKAQHMHVEFIN